MRRSEGAAEGDAALGVLVVAEVRDPLVPGRARTGRSPRAACRRISRTIRLRPVLAGRVLDRRQHRRATPRPRAAGAVYIRFSSARSSVAVAAPAAAADRLAGRGRRRGTRRRGGSNSAGVHRGVVAGCRRSGQPGRPARRGSGRCADRRVEAGQPDLDLTHAYQGTTARGPHRKWSQPAGPCTATAVDGHARRRPCTRPDRPPARPAAPPPGGKVAASAWSSPPARIQVYGSTPSACAASRICRGTSNASRRTSIADPAGRRRRARGRRAARPRRRSWRWRRAGRPAGPAGVGHLRPPVRLDQQLRASGSPGTARCTRPPRTRSGRPGPRTSPGRAPGAQHRRPAVQVAQRGDRDGQGRAGRHVPADHARADRAPPRRPARRPAPRPSAVSRSGRHAERDQQRGRARRPSPRCRPGWPRPPGARRRGPRTSPAGSAAPRPARRWRPPPGRPARPPRPRRRPGRAGSSARTDSRAVTRAISPNSPVPARRRHRGRSARAARSAVLAHRCSLTTDRDQTWSVR